MKDFIIVFTEEDKEKLPKQGLKFVGQQGNGYIFKDSGVISFSEDIKMIRTDMVCL